MDLVGFGGIASFCFHPKAVGQQAVILLHEQAEHTEGNAGFWSSGHGPSQLDSEHHSTRIRAARHGTHRNASDGKLVYVNRQVR